MSNHFTYEIDERNLRVILKDTELPYKEEAWQRFEDYANSQKDDSSNNAFKNIQIPLNRNVILPVTFGFVVIFFAVLLFNFVNIKNPEKDATQNRENKTIITFPEVKPNENSTAPVKKSQQNSTEIKNKEALKVNTPKIIKEPVKTQVSLNIPQNTNTVPESVSVQKSIHTITTAAVTPSVNASQNTATTIGANNGQIVKKKRRRRSGEVVETQTVPESRPNITTEEREPEERPN